MTATGPSSTASGNLVQALETAFRSAIASALGERYAGTDPLIRPSQRPDFGDFQANCAMGLAKQTGDQPRDVAQRIVDAVELDDVAEPLEVAGPGFINIRLRVDALASALETIDASALGVRPSPDHHAVAIDMCSVNVAKQMHVGHLRSSIIGDALARVLERQGRTVHRENHLGDWGLPIAMVLGELVHQGTNLDTLDLATLDRAYRDAQLSARSDQQGLDSARLLGAGPHRIIELEEQNAGAAEAVEAARSTLVKLQGGDRALHEAWQKLVQCTLHALFEALDLLNVNLGPEHNRGESFYRDQLAGVVDAFVRADLAREDRGAIVVPFPDRDRPMLIRKSDGGYLYATTDLAAVRQRVQTMGADRIIYVVDARQRDHFRDLFDAARLIGWDHTPDGAAAELTHIPFGAVLGPDRRPLKTRSGENITLKALLAEAIERGSREVLGRAEDPRSPTHGLPVQELAAIGRAVGVAAIKYADLSNDLSRDYVFDFDRLIAFEGATGPYIQYAHARVCSILGRVEAGQDTWIGATFLLHEPAERQLALLLLRYGQVVEDVARTLEPHRLCAYLYDLADAYSAFYEACPVLRAPDPAIRDSRLRLCDLARRVLADGLGLLGIDAPRRM
jgi:arginyl-tRNA synthetase